MGTTYPPGFKAEAVRPFLVHRPKARAEYVKAVQRHGLIQSMNRKGSCWDNVAVESFFGTGEQELGGRARRSSVT